MHNKAPSPSAEATFLKQPQISVMVPTYEPNHYLYTTLKSILNQDMGIDKMQITIVDDASPNVKIETFLSELNCANRISIIKNERTLGLAKNWNECIKYAQGEFIHILHQDDIVLPGFYNTLCKGLLHNQHVGMAFSGCAFINENGLVTETARSESKKPGIIKNWIERISYRYGVHCPAAIVRKSCYEAIGGYRTDLSFALDWEMWVRIAANFSVWHHPDVLAYYRRHSTNETARLQKLKRTQEDELQAIRFFSDSLPKNARTRLTERAFQRIAHSRIRRAKKSLKKKLFEDAIYQIEGARSAIHFLENSFKKTLTSIHISWVEYRLKTSINN